MSEAMTREAAEALSSRRPRACVEAWPECHSDGYNPRCCRFPKSCSPWIYPEAFMAGNATEADVEPTATEPVAGENGGDGRG